MDKWYRYGVSTDAFSAWAHINTSNAFFSHRNFGLYYYPSASEPSSSSKQNTANYIHIGDVTTNNGDEQTELFSFNLESQFGGFYLAFRDQDSCASISRVQVYRSKCPQHTEGLVRYPETPAGTAAVFVTHHTVCC